MAGNPLFKQIVKALALGEGEQARELNRKLRDDESDDYSIYVSAVFACTLGEIFDEDQSQEAIRGFVGEMSHAYRNANTPFKPLAMEALIRVLFGEDHLLDEVSPEDQLRLQTMAIRMAVHKSPRIQERLDDYLADAETLAAQWQSEG
jgi:hypothetical protein